MSPTEPPTARIVVGTVVFDFDSTLIAAESLEVLVEPRLDTEPGLRERFEAITRKGMDGRLSFSESLAQRLALAKPTRADVRAFAARLPGLWTPEMPDLVASLQHRGVAVWLTSGALIDCLLPAAEQLSVPTSRVRGVRTLWDEDGTLLGPDPDDPFARSKVEGVRTGGLAWTHPSVVVGDGATDRAVVDAGLADWFVAFTGNVERESVIRGVPYVADSVMRLREFLDELIPH